VRGRLSTSAVSFEEYLASVNLILAIPLPLRTVMLFVVGTFAGALVNWAVYTLAWNRRSISPHSAAPDGAPPRRASDRVPVFGWLLLRRESSLHGRAFWVRPLVVELLSGLIFAGLYLWETRYAVEVLPFFGAAPPRADFLTANLPLVAHVRYASHVLLVVLMLAASLVDLDEKTIPDSITVLGTLAALALAAVYPWSLPSAGGWTVAGRPHVEFLTLASPAAWPAGLGGWPRLSGPAVALFCWTLWCGGLMPRYWNTRHGWATAVRVFWHRLRVERVTYVILLLWLAGTAALSLAAWRASAAHWAGLMSALVGMAGGGAVIWAVRVIGAAVLRREAMGFGDVTLMSMIGAFLGWQACLMIFFVAPFFGLAFALANWVFRREREIPYGPFLCLAALTVVLRWPAFWDRTADVFALGWVVPALFAVCLLLLGALLWVYRLIGRLVMRSG
jgi:leader peptidase (prepilin peptidase) / N-methyltransferase